MCRAHYRRACRKSPTEGDIRPWKAEQKKVNLRIPKDVWATFEEEATDRGISIYEAMKQWLAARAHNRKKAQDENYCPTCNLPRRRNR